MGWDGTTCKSHGMGWDERNFFEIPWDGMGLSGEPHGPIFSSHPIPLGALIRTTFLLKGFEDKLAVYDKDLQFTLLGVAFLITKLSQICALIPTL